MALRINNTSAFSEIKLAEGSAVPNRVQVLRVGKFKHPKYGDFEITPKTLSEMKQNFDKRVRGIDVAFDYYHVSDEDASGWVKALELSEDGKELWAVVDWTPKATKKLAERELRYFSPDFTFKWSEPESGKTYNNVLFGGGLTNRPFVKEMQPIVADESKIESEIPMTELEKAQQAAKDAEARATKAETDLTEANKKLAEAIKLTEGGGQAEALKKQIADLQAQLAKLEGENQVMMKEKKLTEEAAATAKKESEFNVLLSEGKAVAAQKDAFLKGDMTEFIKLAQPVNLKAKGSANSQTPDNDDEADQVIKLAEELEKKDPNLDRGTALSQARKQIKESKT